MTTILKRARQRSTAMIRALGLDLDEAIFRGQVPPEETEAIVERCAGCKEPGACEAFLSKTGSPTKAPGYCANKALFDALAP